MENSVLIHNVTIDDFFDKFRSTIREELQLTTSQKKEDPRYLTRKEAAKFLNISVPTLHTYTKTGKLNGYRIGRRVLYKMEDLELNMTSIEISRFRPKNIK